MEEILHVFKKDHLKYLILTSSIFLLYVSLAVATAAKLLASAVAFGQSTKYEIQWNSFIKALQAILIYYKHHVQEPKVIK